jgi:hypothetical protein
MFTERAAGQNIFYVGDKQRRKREIAHGDSVTLKSGDRTVLVRKVHILQPHGFSGEIQGFEPPSPTEEYGEMKVGQRIEFSERHVFGCSSGA